MSSKRYVAVATAGASSYVSAISTRWIPDSCRGGDLVSTAQQHPYRGVLPTRL